MNNKSTACGGNMYVQGLGHLTDSRQCCGSGVFAISFRSRILVNNLFIRRIRIFKAGHNFRCPLKSPLFVDPLINVTAIVFNF
jgi:hypothetical protein